MTKDEARSLADHWVAAWNAHDLDLIMSHYDVAVELTSPVAAQLLGMPDGKIIGKATLRAYFQRGLEAYPDLQFRLADVLCGVNSVVLYYMNQKGTRTAEFMELSSCRENGESCGELQPVDRKGSQTRGPSSAPIDQVLRLSPQLPPRSTDFPPLFMLQAMQRKRRTMRLDLAICVP